MTDALGLQDAKYNAENVVPCAYRKSNPDALAIQSSENRTADNASNCFAPYVSSSACWRYRAF
jgi:hypothetical protein